MNYVSINRGKEKGRGREGKKEGLVVVVVGVGGGGGFGSNLHIFMIKNRFLTNCFCMETPKFIVTT